MLTPLMRMGYGIPETLAALDGYLAPLGVETAVGCMDLDDHFWGMEIHRVRPDSTAVLDLAARLGVDCVIAHGSPFFEVLPALTGTVRTIAYEYGDPTPELFPSEAPLRRRIADDKKALVYPHVDAVAAISAFVRHDIGWPAARVITLGIEHVPDLGPKLWVPPTDINRPLRVGTLMRLGPGEAQYKGNDLLLRLAQMVTSMGSDAQFEIMGRGSKEDARHFLDAGFTVQLNASDEERTEFLRRVDVFVSPSQWEGCNLPLVEAQALGTPGLAFDTGAHPEFTPLVFSSLPAMAQQLAAYDRNRDPLLRDHGLMSYRFIRQHMSWERTSQQLANLIAEGRQYGVPRRRTMAARMRFQVKRARGSVKRRGVRGAAASAGKKWLG